MGWVRCTYRTCTVKSDKKTHMFHYPVFDKVRCHQWLVNARRLDLLNLTVSQLKNRTICQHHFVDDFFMNTKKDKLKKYAVPTIDGPYCIQQETEDTTEVPFNITADLIDDEVVPSVLAEKMANYSTKYGDFLTNCEIMNDDDKINYHNIRKQRENTIKAHFSEKLSKDIKKILNPRISNPIPTKKYVEIELAPAKPINKVYVETENFGLIEQKPLTFTEDKEQVINKFQPISAQLSQKSTMEQTMNHANMMLHPNFSGNTLQKKTKNHSKVQILSVKTILPGQLFNTSFASEPISDVTPPQPQINQTIAFENKCSENSPSKIKEPLIIIENPTKENMSTKALEQNTGVKRKLVESDLSKSPKIKALRTSDETAKIQEKRNFNMKLGDIIKNSLNQLSKENFKESLELFKANEASKSKPEKTSILKEAVSSDKEKITGSHQYVISYLEARMKKMEDLLLNRIDNNTQRINELKNSLNEDKSKVKGEEVQDTAPARPQGKRSEEVHKKKLYQEICKYLKPETNSLLYEELFINKAVESVPRYSTRNLKRT